jgi:glycine cleavage system H lipoate-binding protein
MSVLLVITLIVAFLALDFLLESRRKKEAAAKVLFHRGHTWALLTETGFARIGLDEFARRIVGTIDRIECPEPGRTVRRGEPLFAVVRGSRKIEFVSPVDGRVISVRPEAAKAAFPKDDPYRKGYFLTLKPENVDRNAPDLKSAADAPGWIERELVRLYEFVGMRTVVPHGIGATMRDGGTYVTGIVERIDEPLLKELVLHFLR